ncbi:MAG: hypothetical protein RIS76_168 [Verrucomicrobiota bacterium]|jgi:hypothetical protein
MVMSDVGLLRNSLDWPKIHRIPSGSVSSQTRESMTKKPWTLIGVAVVLGALYVFRFSDLWRTRQIQINVSSRPFAPNAAPDDPLPIIFGLDQDWRLTGIRVTALIQLSNAHPHVAWDLTAKSGSDPTRGFIYGDTVAGMQSVGRAAPDKLTPGLRYRLEVVAARARGTVDFTPQAAGEPK